MTISSILIGSSLLLGLLSWALPVVGTNRLNKGKNSNPFICSALSFIACAASLCLVLFEINNRVKAEDWSTLMDTCGALTAAAVVLVVITAGLNLFTIALYHESKQIK